MCRKGSREDCRAGGMLKNRLGLGGPCKEDSETTWESESADLARHGHLRLTLEEVGFRSKGDANSHGLKE